MEASRHLDVRARGKKQEGGGAAPPAGNGGFCRRQSARLRAKAPALTPTPETRPAVSERGPKRGRSKGALVGGRTKRARRTEVDSNAGDLLIPEGKEPEPAPVTAAGNAVEQIQPANGQVINNQPQITVAGDEDGGAETSLPARAVDGAEADGGAPNRRDISGSSSRGEEPLSRDDIDLGVIGPVDSTKEGVAGNLGRRSHKPDIRDSEARGREKPPVDIDPAVEWLPGCGEKACGQHPVVEGENDVDFDFIGAAAESQGKFPAIVKPSLDMKEIRIGDRPSVAEPPPLLVFVDGDNQLNISAASCRDSNNAVDEGDDLDFNFNGS